MEAVNRNIRQCLGLTNSHTSDPHIRPPMNSFGLEIYSWNWKGFTLSIHYPLIWFSWNNIIFYGFTELPLCIRWYISLIRQNPLIVHLISTHSGGNFSRSPLTGILKVTISPQVPVVHLLLLSVWYFSHKPLTRGLEAQAEGTRTDICMHSDPFIRWH